MTARAPASERSQEQERLLVEAAQNNPARFGELYEMHFDLVYGFVARRVGNRETAEDVTADVFHKALANLSRFEWRGAPFATWLLRIAANAIADRANRNSREVLLEQPDELSSTTPLAGPELEAAEEQAQLFRLVEQLPADQRRVIHMRFGEEKSIREIAQQLRRTEGAVKQLQFRALTRLRSQVEGANA